MKEPIFLKWTVIPPAIVALAWTDISFRNEFVKWPTQTLDEIGLPIPEKGSFCVVENSADIHHLVLPYRNPKTFGWSREKIIDVLTEETGCDESLEFWLPVDIMADAFIYPEFKTRLYKDLNAVLAERGYDLDGLQYSLLENTEKTYHLVLPVNKWLGYSLDAEELEELLIEDFIRRHAIH